MKSRLAIVSIGIVALALTCSATAAKKTADNVPALIEACTKQMVDKSKGQISRKEASDYCTCYIPAVDKIRANNPELAKTEKGMKQLLPQLMNAAMTCTDKVL